MIGQGGLSPRDEKLRRLLEAMRRHLGDLGRFLVEPDVSEIMRNPDGTVWIDRAGVPMAMVGTLSDEATEAFIAVVASMQRAVVNHNAPRLKGRLPLDGSRFQFWLPPLSVAPSFSIRRHSSVVFPLTDYEARGIMAAAQRREIERAIDGRLNIIVSGGTLSGKTTLLNACLLYRAETAPHLRQFVLEDTPELRVKSPNFVSLCTDEDAGVTMRTLVQDALRGRPDCIIVGESRSGDAMLETLKSWNTGHDGGMSTVHANSTEQTLTRIEDLLLEVSPTPLCRLIADAINLIVHIQHDSRLPAGRRITEVLAIKGWRDGEYQAERLA